MTDEQLKAAHAAWAAAHQAVVAADTARYEASDECTAMTRALRAAAQTAHARAAWAAMSTEQRDAMACAAPEFAGPWQHVTADLWTRYGFLPRPAAYVNLIGRAFVAKIEVTRGRTTQLDQFTSLELAQAACDAALRAAGWALAP